MTLEYNIAYTTHNYYEATAVGAYWQMAIVPEDNISQQLIHWRMNSNIAIKEHLTTNAFGFKVIHVKTEHQFQHVNFEVSFLLQKTPVNPFEFTPNLDILQDYQEIESLELQVAYEVFLRRTRFTALPAAHDSIFIFDRSQSIFENLQQLNHWVYVHLFFKTGVTDTNTSLAEIIEKRNGVCQDFTHLFLAIARRNKIPCRYVSGYLHQGNGYFGDAQMHAWAEAYVPKGGWIGFDPTNDILVADNHIKVCHGLDYSDCSPLKGVVYGNGGNSTKHEVKVWASQQ